jgi:hypothetical protein
VLGDFLGLGKANNKSTRKYSEKVEWLKKQGPDL